MPAAALVLLAFALIGPGCSEMPPDRGGTVAPFEDVTGSHLPTLDGPSMDARPADLDGDGDLDLVVAMEFAPNVLLLNDGTGRFTDASDRLPRTRHDSEDIAIADFDGDGRLDLYLAGRGSQDRLLLRR